VLAGCGDEDQRPKPDREQIRDVVVDFFTDVADDDAKAACDKLTAVGRTQTLGLDQTIGAPTKPSSEEMCVDAGIPILRDSNQLSTIVDNGLLRVRRVDISGDRAQAITMAAAFKGVQHLRRTDDGWKINRFEPMVHD
jgi:hypothetical protein